MSEIKWRPEIKPHPECKACVQGYPIHADEHGEKRQHIEVLAGISADCPTQNWPDEEEE